MAAPASPTLHRLPPELYDRLVDSGLPEADFVGAFNNVHGTGSRRYSPIDYRAPIALLS